MKPDWNDAPEWANYLAMDKDRTWWWYEKEPFVENNDKYWRIWRHFNEEDGMGRFIKVKSSISWKDSLEKSWKDSLEKRSVTKPSWEIGILK